MKVDILIFVEDPGAANYVHQLPGALSARNINVKLLTRGIAGQYLEQFKVHSETISENITALQVLERYIPAVLVTGSAENPDSMGLKLIEAARLKQIVSVGVIDAGINAEYRFRGTTNDALHYAPDWLLVPDEWTANRFALLGYKKERLLVCGHPRYDYVRSAANKLSKKDLNKLKKRIFPGWTHSRPVWLFAAEISTGCDPGQFQYSNEYTLRGSGRYTDRTRIILEEFLDSLSILDERPYLVLRLHPKNTIEEFREFADYFDQVSKEENVLEMIYGSDVIVGMTSMLLMEAVLMEKQTLSIVPRAVEKEWLPSIRKGITPCVTTRDELNGIIKKMLSIEKNPEHIKSSKLVVEGSLKRVLELINRFLRQPN